MKQTALLVVLLSLASLAVGQTATSFSVGSHPYGLVFDGANVWVANSASNTVTKLRASDGAVLGTFDVGTGPLLLIFDGAAIWVTNNTSATITKLRGSDGAVLGTFPSTGNLPYGIKFDGANIWVTSVTTEGTGLITKLRASDAAQLGVFTIGTPPCPPPSDCVSDLAFDGTNIWVADPDNNSVFKVRAIDGSILGNFPVGTIATGLAFDGTNIWVTDAGDNSVTKLRGSDGAVLGTFPVGNVPTGIAFDGTNLWVSNRSGNNVTELRPSDGFVLGTFAVGTGPTGVVFDGSSVWVANYGSNTVTKLSASSPPTINAGGVVNAASYLGPVVPGSIAAAFGNFLHSSPSGALGIPLPTDLSGLFLQFGNGIRAPLFYASGGQVNLQVPWELAQEMQSPLTASVSNQTSAPQTVNLATFAPAIFSMNSQGSGQGAILDTSYRLVDESNPATPGTTYIQIYCTGLGPVTNQPPSGSPAPASPPFAETTTTPTVTIGGVPAVVVPFSGLAPGYVGLYQVDALVPAGAPGGASVPVIISMGATASNNVTIAIKGAVVMNPQPSISGLSPASVTAGSGTFTGTISGSGFIAESSVAFDGRVHAAVFVTSSTLTITLSMSDLAVAGSFPVVVTNPSPGGGVSNTVNFNVTTPVVMNPQPSISSLSPASGTAGSGPLTVTINGSGFMGASSVIFNGTSHWITFISGTQLSITLSASDLNSTGSFPVVVINPSPGGGASNTATFTVTVAQASVAGTWQGTWVSNSGPSGSFGAGLTQTGGTLSGTMLLLGSSCFIVGNVSGTITGDTLLLGALLSLGGPTSQLEFTGTADSSGFGQGSYSVESGPCAGDSGAFSMTRLPGQPSIAGNWQGTWLSVTGLNGSLSANISQSGTDLTAPISLTGSPCFTTGVAGGSITAQEILLGAAFDGSAQVLFDGILGSTGTTISGAYAVAAGACEGDYGAFSVTQIQ